MGLKDEQSRSRDQIATAKRSFLPLNGDRRKHHGNLQKDQAAAVMTGPVSGCIFIFRRLPGLGFKTDPSLSATL